MCIGITFTTITYVYLSCLGYSTSPTLRIRRGLSISQLYLYSAAFGRMKSSLYQYSGIEATRR